MALSDDRGFLISGDRQQTLSLGPRDKGLATWQLVAAAPGHHAAPGIRVNVPKIGCSAITNNVNIYISPT